MNRRELLIGTTALAASTSLVAPTIAASPIESDFLAITTTTNGDNTLAKHRLPAFTSWHDAHVALWSVAPGFEPGTDALSQEGKLFQLIRASNEVARQSRRGLGNRLSIGGPGDRPVILPFVRFTAPDIVNLLSPKPDEYMIFYSSGPMLPTYDGAILTNDDGRLHALHPQARNYARVLRI